RGVCEELLQRGHLCLPTCSVALSRVTFWLLLTGVVNWSGLRPLANAQRSLTTKMGLLCAGIRGDATTSYSLIHVSPLMPRSLETPGFPPTSSGSATKLVRMFGTGYRGRGSRVMGHPFRRQRLQRDGHAHPRARAEVTLHQALAPQHDHALPHGRQAHSLPGSGPRGDGLRYKAAPR